MCQSESINELAAALAKAQGQFTAAKRESQNPFFKSKYADMNSVWNACKAPLSENGLAILQTLDYKEGQLILITTLAHASGQWIKSYMPIVTEKNNAHGIGAAVTYMRRYSLSAIIGMTTDEEDDGNAAVTLPPKGSNKREVNIPYVSLNLPPEVDRERVNEFISLSASTRNESEAYVRQEASKHLDKFLERFRAWEGSTQAVVNL